MLAELEIWCCADSFIAYKYIPLLYNNYAFSTKGVIFIRNYASTAICTHVVVLLSKPYIETRGIAC